MKAQAAQINGQWYWPIAAYLGAIPCSFFVPLFPLLMACSNTENGCRKKVKGKEWKEPFGRNQATKEKKGDRTEKSDKINRPSLGENESEREQVQERKKGKRESRLLFLTIKRIFSLFLSANCLYSWFFFAFRKCVCVETGSVTVTWRAVWHTHSIVVKLKRFGRVGKVLMT